MYNYYVKRGSGSTLICRDAKIFGAGECEEKRKEKRQ